MRYALALLAVGSLLCLESQALAQAGRAKQHADTPTVASPCVPVCEQGQICMSNGQCMKLVPVESLTSPERPEAMETTRRNSTPMMVTGIVLAGIGGAFAATGAMYMVLADLGCSESSNSYTACKENARQVGTAGTIMAIGGTLTALVGIPLIVTGARRVPYRDVALVVGPGAVSVLGSF